MAFKTIGSIAQLQLTIPTEGTTGWTNRTDQDLWLPVASHDHTENGKGVKLGTNSLQDGSITSPKLADDAVATAKISDGAISTAKIANDAVNSSKIVDAAITTSKILDANVTAAKLASDSVTTAKILDANVTNAKLATDAVTNDKVANDAINTAKIVANAVDDTKIRLRNNQYLKGRNAANSADIDIVKINASNVIEFAGSVTATPAANSVGPTELQSNAVTTVKIADSNVSTAKIADFAVTRAKLQNGNLFFESSVIEVTSSTYDFNYGDLYGAGVVLYITHAGNVTINFVGTSIIPGRHMPIYIINKSGGTRTYTIVYNTTLTLSSFANNTMRTVFQLEDVFQLIALPAQTVTFGV